MKQAKIEKKQLNELILWDKNPRAIHEVDYKRLKDLIEELGLFKPFVINQDNVILGGNMRYRVCKDLGYKEVYVSTVETNNEAEMFSYALADNDRAGYYEEDKLQELIINTPEINLQRYKVDIGMPVTLETMLGNIDNLNDSKEIDFDEIDSSAEIKLIYFGEVYLEVLSLLEKAKNKLQLETDEEVILQLLKDCDV